MVNCYTRQYAGHKCIHGKVCFALEGVLLEMMDGVWMRTMLSPPLKKSKSIKPCLREQPMGFLYQERDRQLDGQNFQLTMCC